ncbi:MAG: restriction endonuclease subunit S [Bacillota bacterium]
MTCDGTFDFTRIKFVPRDFADRMSKGHIQKYDILIVKDGATTGKTAFVDDNFPYETAVVNEHVFICRVSEVISPKFVFRYLMSEEGRNEILRNFQGSAQGGINSSFASNVEVPLAPVNEQHRILAKLEKLLTKVDNCKERLDRIPVILKRFRQSVLAAACSGRLTADWREKNPDVEPASELLRRIKKERMKQQCRENNVKARVDVKYTAKRDAQDLPVIPISWAYTYLGNIIFSFQYGTSEKSDYSFEGIPVLRIPNLVSMGIDLRDLKYLKRNDIDDNHKVRNGDLLIVRSNGSRELIGKSALVQNLTGKMAFASYLIRLRPLVVLSEYVLLLLNTEYIKSQFFSKAKSTAGINNINTKELSSTIIPLPPLEEQLEIVRRVEALFKIADQVEARYEKAKAYVDRLTQAIFAKAFRGELVPQDPDDEPASVLLERIREERARREAELRTAGRRRQLPARRRKKAGKL